MTKCVFCKKDYGTYTMLFDEKIECFLMENWIKEIYYNHEKDEGVCEECRNKEFYKNPVWLIRNWMVIKAQLQTRLFDFLEEKNVKMIKITKEAIRRISKTEKKLEQTPEVIKLYKENNPARFKEPLKDGEFCAYCGEVEGQVWINNPNPKELIKEGEECWFVCKNCKKVIELQTDLTYASAFGDDKRVLEINEKLEKISKKTGQPIFSGEIEKKKDGSFGVSSVEFGVKK